MFTYFYRIKDKFPQRPITAIAILTDSNKYYRPAVYCYDFLGASVNYQFNTYKIMDQDEETLLKDDNPFVIVILAVLLALKRQKRLSLSGGRLDTIQAGCRHLKMGLVDTLRADRSSFEWQTDQPMSLPVKALFAGFEALFCCQGRYRVLPAMQNRNGCL